MKVFILFGYHARNRFRRVLRNRATLKLSYGVRKSLIIDFLRI